MTKASRIATMTTAQLRPYASEYQRRMRARQADPPKVLRPCKYCGQLFGAVELRGHNQPACRREQKAALTR
jgi:hypothetical protein